MTDRSTPSLFPPLPKKPAPRLTYNQEAAPEMLKKDTWRAFSMGYGWANVSLRTLLQRAPDLLERKVEDGREMWRLR